MTSTSHEDLEGSHTETEKELELSSPDGSLNSACEHPVEAGIQAEEGLDGGALEKKATKFSVNNVSSIPNGGLRAWLQVLGVFFIFFNTW